MPAIFRPILSLLCLATATLAADSWPEFRGPTQQGHSDAQALPQTWSESRNIKWKTQIPGEGWSSPVIWGNQVWVTSAAGEGHSLRAICLDKDSGKIIHNVEVFAPEKLDRKHATNTFASPTPVIEEGRIFVSFGNYGNACLDTATARPVWKSNELKLEHYQGPGSSPILYKDLFILNCDGTDVQYVAALKKETGQIAWKTPRTYPFDKLNIDPDERKAYSTPILLNIDGKDQIISIGAHRVSGYEPDTGKEIWYCDLPGFSNVPRPVYGDGLLFVCTGYNKADLFAIRVPGAAGNVSDTNIAWKFNQGVSLKPSLLLVKDRLFMIGDEPGIARCIEAKTGKQIWQMRLGDTYTASPFDADGKVYFVSEQGETTILPAEGKPKVLSRNELDEGGKSTPAISGNAIYLRTKSTLYRIEK